jgi:P pilus assembly chaperone PapD
VSRSGAGSALGCDSPAPERWFTGVGASAEHASTLTLVNPDKGPAVADVTVWDGSGVVDVPALRGVRVPGGRSTSFDLATVVPNRDALAVRVTVTRGRLASTVVDVVDPVGRDAPVREWLPAQAAPATTSYVAGLGTSAADRVLTVANPGDSEVRVALKLASEESEFAPAGVEEVTVAPGSVREVDLSGVLRGPALQGVQALRLESTGPVTASLRTRTATDLALSVAGSTVTGEAAVALPDGSKRLVLVGADAPGVVTLRAWDADGNPVVRERRVEVDPATASRLRLPDDAVLAVVGVERTGVVAALEVTDRGLSVLPLSQLETTSQVPDVRPAQR